MTMLQALPNHLTISQSHIECFATPTLPSSSTCNSCSARKQANTGRLQLVQAKQLFRCHGTIRLLYMHFKLITHNQLS